MLAFVFLPAISRGSRCSALVPLTNTVLLLCAPMLPTWWVKISTYLHLEPVLLIASMLLILNRIYYYYYYYDFISYITTLICIIIIIIIIACLFVCFSAIMCSCNLPLTLCCVCPLYSYVYLYCAVSVIGPVAVDSAHK
jgi:hypothetical protein